MLVEMLKSKIYKAPLTKVSIEYSGSFGIDEDIMDEVGIKEYEKILVINTSTRDRFETYCIKEPRGSKAFCLYGGAARLGVVGDYVIILSFAQVEEEKIPEYKPKILNY